MQPCADRFVPNLNQQFAMTCVHVINLVSEARHDPLEVIELHARLLYCDLRVLRGLQTAIPIRRRPTATRNHVDNLRSAQEDEANARPQIIVRGDHDQGLRSRLRQMHEIDGDHGVDQFLLGAFQHRARCHHAPVSRTRAVPDEPFDACYRTARRFCTIRERRCDAPQPRRQRPSAIRVCEFDSGIADQASGELCTNEQDVRTIPAGNSHRTRKLPLHLRKKLPCSRRQRRFVEPAAVQPALHVALPGQPPATEHLEQAGHDVPHAETALPHIQIIVVDECNHVAFQSESRPARPMPEMKHSHQAGVSMPVIASPSRPLRRPVELTPPVRFLKRRRVAG